MLKFYVRHGMKVDKNYEINSFEQSKWLEKYICLNTQQRNKAKNDFKKTPINYLKTHFVEK